jgi:hypothetical protein
MSTFDCTQLKGHLRSICDGTHRKADGRAHTVDHRREIIGRYLRQDASQIVLPMPTGVPVQLSDIGTRLHEIIGRDTKAHIECSECRDEVTRLNLMTVAQVQQQRETIAEGIVERGKRKAPKFWQRWGARLAPGLAKQQALTWIDEACQPLKRKHSPRVPFNKINEDAHFCWIYWAGEQESDEIRWSIRSVERNYAGTARITIIGDRPSWYDGHCIEQPRVGPQPFRRYRDTLSKIRTMIDSEEIRGTIVWCMDDCYFLKQGFTLADLRGPWKTFRSKFKGSDDWCKVNRATEAAVRNAGLPYHAYVTHMPQIVDREKLKWCFANFDFLKLPLAWETLYGCKFAPDAESYESRLIRVNRRGVTVKDCEKAKAQKVVLNHHHGSWSNELAQWLRDEFPD